MLEVAAKRCKNYNREKIKQIIYEIFSSQKFLNRLNNLDSALLKPNLLGPYSPEKGITTHPEFIAAVIEILKDYNIKISLLDNPGGTVKYEKVLHDTGMEDLSKKYDIEILYSAISGIRKFKKFTSEKLIENIEYIVSKPFVECQAIINLPKLKTHTLTLFTGAIKNCYGVVPGLAKSSYHRIAPNPTKFAKIVVDIYKIVKDKIAFNLMDGIVGMDGDGPSSGDTKNFGVILGGTDAVALDFCASRMMGYNPKKIPTIKFAADQTQISLDDIRLIGDFSENFTLKNVNIKKSKITNLILRGLSTSFKNVFQKIFWAYPTFDPEKCTKCGICVKSCPTSALKISSVSPISSGSPDGKDSTIPQLSREKCILCLCCIEMCPENAAYLEKSFIAKYLIK
ncbi:MAG: DUF362 domain-containing protein [Candidatus Cloacimonadota bacterium]|nr:DUF362 domain-containing protein [Candidatus Cloacimonadota bacterium]